MAAIPPPVGQSTGFGLVALYGLAALLLAGFSGTQTWTGRGGSCVGSFWGVAPGATVRAVGLAWTAFGRRRP